MIETIVVALPFKSNRHPEEARRRARDGWQYHGAAQVRPDLWELTFTRERKDT